MRKLRGVIASIFVSMANLFTCALPGLLIFRGVAQESEVPLAVYLGVLIAAALYVAGFAAAGRLRQALPGAITVVVVGAIAQPLAFGISVSVHNANWLLASLLIALPIALVVAGLRIGNRLSQFGGAKTPPNTSLERTRDR